MLLPLDPSSAGPAPVLSRNELFCSPAAARLLAVNHPKGLTESISPSTRQGMMLQKEERIWFLKHAESCLSQSIKMGRCNFKGHGLSSPGQSHEERESCSSAKPACAKQKHTQHSACKSCHGHSAFRTVQSPAGSQRDVTAGLGCATQQQLLLGYQLYGEQDMTNLWRRQHFHGTVS